MYFLFKTLTHRIGKNIPSLVEKINYSRGTISLERACLHLWQPLPGQSGREPCRTPERAKPREQGPQRSETGAPGRPGRGQGRLKSRVFAGSRQRPGLSHVSGSPSRLSLSPRFLSSGATDASYLESHGRTATRRKRPTKDRSTRQDLAGALPWFLVELGPESASLVWLRGGGGEEGPAL